MGFEGLVADDLGLTGMTPCDGKRGRPDDWSAVLTQWHERIDALVIEFIQGQSDVTPRDSRACNYCGLEPVCRINERQQFHNDTGDEA